MARLRHLKGGSLRAKSQEREIITVAFHRLLNFMRISARG